MPLRKTIIIAANSRRSQKESRNKTGGPIGEKVVFFLVFWNMLAEWTEATCPTCGSSSPGVLCPAEIPLVCHSHESGNPVVFFLDSCLRRNNTGASPTAGRGQLLHSAKMLRFSGARVLACTGMPPSATWWNSVLCCWGNDIFYWLWMPCSGRKTDRRNRRLSAGQHPPKGPETWNSQKYRPSRWARWD